MRRREFVTLIGGTATWPFVARAQQSALPVVGLLSSQSAAAVARPLAAFHAALAELGYDEGKSVTIEYRWAEGRYDRLPVLATELVQRNVSVIVALGGDPAALAAKTATSAIPMVFIVGSDPVKFGLVASLSRPEGNATGVNLFITEIEPKRVGLLHQLVPKATKIAALVNPKTANAITQAKDIQAAAERLGLPAEIFDASSETEIASAFDRIPQSKLEPLIVQADPFFVARRGLIISLAKERDIPAIYPLREFPDSGGLISYGTDLVKAYHQVGNYAGRILRGERAGDLPVVQLEKFETVINLKAAKDLGVTVPPELLATADEVIE